MEEGTGRKEWLAIAAEKGMKGLPKIPVGERTAEVCIAAVRAGSQTWYMPCIPEAARKEPAFWLEAFKAGVCGMADVPQDAMTPELCALALEEWPLALRFMPDRLKTQEACAEAFARDSRAALFVPEAWQTEAMKDAACALQDEADAMEKGLAEAPAEPEKEGVAGGGHVKVRSVAFLPPGAHYPRYGELDGEMQEHFDAGDGDIVVTEWGEPGGSPWWNYQIFRHAVLPEDEAEGRDFDPDDFCWDAGTDYALNRIRASYYSEFPMDFQDVVWQSIAGASFGGEEDDARQAEAYCGVWADVKGFGLFPLKFGDIWNASGRRTACWNSLGSLYEEPEHVLCDAVRWTNPHVGRGEAIALSMLAFDDFGGDDEFSSWFAEAGGPGGWISRDAGLSPVLLAEETGGTYMAISRNEAEGGDAEQFFADSLEWGMIATVVHYGDFEAESGEEMNAYFYDDYAEFGLVGMGS